MAGNEIFADGEAMQICSRGRTTLVMHWVDEDRGKVFPLFKSHTKKAYRGN
jgi:hypothetical protein